MSEGPARKRRKLQSAESGPYVLRKLLDDIPLSDDGSEGVGITCVEFWSDNLYIGTSASEILHLVCLPGENEFDAPQYILASRQQPSGHDAAPTSHARGVQQILVLPGALKACVLCNGTASFFSLPEMSPAFPGKEPTGVQWIGGYDENEGRDNPDGTIIMIATTRRILQVRVGDKLRPVRPNIEYPDCLGSSRRGTIACVANKNSYALLEIEHQQKIPLFDISSAPEPEEAPPTHLAPPQDGGQHARSTSLGALPESPSERSASPDKAASPHLPPRNEDASRPPNRARASTAGTSPSAPPLRLAKQLKPHVLSPSTNEFMLTTGTAPTEPGVGMFVNLDGDVTRGTIEFDQYPEALLLHSFSDSAVGVRELAEAPCIVALLEKSQSGLPTPGLEVQSLDVDSATAAKAWLPLSSTGQSLDPGRAGLHQSLSTQRHIFVEVAELLQAVRYKPEKKSDPNRDPDPETKFTAAHRQEERMLLDPSFTRSKSPSAESEQRRKAEELKFVQRLGHVSSRALVWSDTNLWQLLPNPLLLQLECELLSTLTKTNTSYDFTKVNVSKLLSFLGSARERDPQDETEFLGLKYARQKASVLLFLHLLAGIKENSSLKSACKLVESALHESELDPRVPLLLLQPLAPEVLHGQTGIFLQQGIVDCLSEFDSPINSFKDASTDLWLMIRHFLSTWQEKRGFGSISDEKSVFDSVDAALLRLLLQLDLVLAKGDSSHAPIRAKLNNVVDHWKGDFDRAVVLLEHYKRLYVLSRLYQSRRSARDVLRTWARICEGEENADTEPTIDAIQLQIRQYLTVIRDRALVQEYAIWLAQRSPEVAVQVLSDDSSRVKFEPAQVVALLKEHAPGSVQLFLEHLVFTKNLDQYADDLVGYYLDSVLSVLEESEQARQSLADSYTTYRALTSPKPTYLNFVTQNAPERGWWQSRLRLLQLLGSGGYATPSGSSKPLTYSIDKVLDRLKPFSTYLVSEAIILDARQGRHNEALRLLVHGLGDYDTAVRYCYFGGPTAPSGTIDVSLLPIRSQQQEQFQFLFTEFLKIQDSEERLERTSHLLGTFATWFDPLTILSSIPDSWSVSLLSEFLLRTFRAATTEKKQAIIVKALSAAQNLQKQAEFIKTCETIGAKLETEESHVNDQPNNDIATS